MARRVRSARLAVFAALLSAPLAVAGAAYLAAERDDRTHASAGAPLITDVVPGRSGAAGSELESDPLSAASPLPDVSLDGVDSFHVYLRRPPRAGLVLDLADGRVLWRRRPLQSLPIASLTKIMTALLVVQRTKPGEAVRITPAALRYEGSGVGLLPKGRRVRLETLLNGLMIVSGNDAAIALAGHVSGSERRFVRLMNRRARDWGLVCTRFASSHGLEDANRSCPRDLAVLTRMAMAQPRIRRIARRRQVAFRFPVKGGRLYLSGHNPLMRMGYRGAVGLKTGYTDAAGLCFVGVVRRGGRRLAVVLLDSRDPGRHARKLLDAALAGG